MNLIGRYDDSDISLEGHEPALLELARLLRKAGDADVRPLMIPPTPPDPYNSYATSLKVEHGASGVRIARNQSQIRISGSSNKLAALAENIEWIANGNPANIGSNHIHIEYHPGHFYLEEESIPLVISKSPSA